MDLIISFYESYSVVPMQVLGTPLMGLTIFAMGLVRFFQYLMSIPLVSSLVNTTSVFLNNTQEVWRPLYNSSLVLFKPFSGALKPFGDVGLLFAEMTVRAMILMGYVTVVSLRETAKYLLQFALMTRDAGLSLTTSFGNAFVAIKDFTVAVFSLFRGFGYVTINLVKSAGFVVNSFESVSDFLYQFAFYPHTITWSDISNIVFPFAIVATILGYVFWRSYRILAPPVNLNVQVQHPLLEDEEPVLRRSSRIARKRALLSCHGLESFSSEKSSSGTTNL